MSGSLDRDPETRAAGPGGFCASPEQSTTHFEAAESVSSEKKDGTNIFVTLLRTKDTGKDPGPPPDGGLQAWVQVILGHLVMFNTWGYVNSYGVFQSYYTKALDRPPSDIAWMGSVQIFLLFFVGTFSGRATDAGWFKLAFLCGVFLQLLGLFAASGATKYYQVFLSQGICVGLGNGMMVCPSISVVAPYFIKHRGFALGFVATGAATGGLVYPALASRLLPVVGYPWTMRILGFVTLATHIPSFLFFRPRFPPRKAGPVVEWTAFKESPYVFFMVGMFFNFWGLYIAFFYLGTFGRDEFGLAASASTNLLMIQNGLGIPARIIPTLLADRFVGIMNSLVPFSLGCAICMYCWAAVSSIPGLYVFSVFNGIVAAGIQSFFPSTVTVLTDDMTKTGVRLGMVFSFVSFACLTGPPLAGALIQLNGGHYFYTQMFAGSSILLGFCLVFTSRIKKKGFRMVKV